MGLIKIGAPFCVPFQVRDYAMQQALLRAGCRQTARQWARAAPTFGG